MSVRRHFFRLAVLTGAALLIIQGSASAASPVPRFAPSGELKVTLRLGEPHSGALLRFTRNRLTLERRGALVLSLSRAGEPPRSLQTRAAGTVTLVLSASRGRATLSAGASTVTLRARLVTEDRVVVRAPHAVRRLRIVSDLLRGRRRAPAPAQSGAPEPAAPAATPTPAPSPSPARVARLFAPDSVWNAPLAPGTALDPDSAELVRKLSDLVAADRAAYRGPWIATNQASTPLYVVPADQPVVSVTLHTGSWGDTLQDVLRSVPIPPNARPAQGSDAHLTVWQPSTDRLWELFGARRDRDTGWQADYGGAIDRVSISPGYYDANSWPGKSGSHWGATATSLPVIAGTMLISELQAGVIPHALALAIPWARRQMFSFPAQRTDGRNSDPEAIPEGARFRLDPSLDLSTLRLPRMTRMIAEAAQTYGMIVRDQTGWGVSLYAEDPTPFGTDPYYGPRGLFGNRWPHELLDSFPWDRLQLVRMDLRHL
jgi:hypothetical protein